MSDELVVETPTYTLVVEPLPTYQIIVGGGGSGEVGPEGPEGPAGPAGADGADGATGPAGPSNTIVTTDPATLTSGTWPDGGFLIRSGLNFIGKLINGFTTKTTPVAADLVMIGDSAASFATKGATLSSLATAIGASGGSGTGNPLVDAPASPHADNDEFTAWSGWTVWDGTSNLVDDGNGTVDPWTSPAAGHYRHTITGSLVLLQFPNTSGTSYYIYKAITPAADMLWWARLSTGHNFNNSGGTGMFNNVTFATFPNSGGRPVITGSGYTGGGYTLGAGSARNIFSIQQGVGQSNGVSPVSGAGVLDIVGIFEHSTTSRHIFFADSRCLDFTIDNSSPWTASRTTAYVGFRVLPNTKISGGASPILCLDYVRRKDSATAFII